MKRLSKQLFYVGFIIIKETQAVVLILWKILNTFWVEVERMSDFHQKNVYGMLDAAAFIS